MGRNIVAGKLMRDVNVHRCQKHTKSTSWPTGKVTPGQGTDGGGVKQHSPKVHERKTSGLVSPSTSEAEYKAANAGGREMLWL